MGQDWSDSATDSATTDAGSAPKAFLVINTAVDVHLRATDVVLS
jgi:hypothetical protein